MKKTFFFAVFLCFISLVSFSQKVVVNAYFVDKGSTPDGDTIYYEKDRALTWKDFQGEPVQDHFGAAVTSSGFGYGAGIHITKSVININVGIYTFFDKSTSWRRSFISSDYHLTHEQHHFDITRLGAEMFRTELLKAKFTKDNYRQLLDDIFEKVHQHNVALQDIYDGETEHSLNKEKQLSWNDKISHWVTKLGTPEFIYSMNP